jgi:peptidoglycan L-alanyl-D-glutamate endopeptidase CwlK
MGFVLDAASLARATHVDPRMIAIAKLAAQLSTQPFCFTEEQSRTQAQEAALVARGMSHTLKSHHIIDCSPAWAEPGFSGAVDAVPLVGGKPVWDWTLIYPVAVAFRAASLQLGVPITWGGCWDKLMNEYAGDTPAQIAAAEQAYAARQHAAGNRNVLLDGPHYELGRN